MRYVSLVLSILVIAILSFGCGGGGKVTSVPGGAIVDNQSGDQPGGQVLVKVPALPLERVASTAGHGSGYSDEVVDWTWDLIAGQSILVGTVQVTNDGETIFVTYTTQDGWQMSEAHVYVGATPPNIKGAPGQFPYGMDFNPAVTTYTFEIPLGNIPDKNAYYVAAHAIVFLGDQTETAWGGSNGAKVKGKYQWDLKWNNKWGGYFTTKCHPVFEPIDWSYKAWFYNYSPKDEYWRIQFEPTDPTNPPIMPNLSPAPYWDGWCVDPTVLYENTSHVNRLFSCYDPALQGTYAQSDHWDCISWILNERQKAISQYKYSWDVTQRAILYFKYGNAGGLANDQVCAGTSVSYDNSSDVCALVAAAKTYGEGYLPSPGQYYAVILFPLVNGNLKDGSEGWQMNIIAVDP